MPLLDADTYRPAPPFGSGHLSTIWPTLLRRVPKPAWRRERLELPDGDFLDLDRLEQGGPRTAILCHGLEGSSRARYMRGMAAALSRRGWNVTAVNYRGCSGEPNRLARSYHSGASDDLARVVDHVAAAGGGIDLVGFSLGGNLILKYLGEDPAGVHPAVGRAAVFSVPVDLADSAARLDRPANRIYVERFLRRLRRKMRRKALIWPERVDPGPLAGIRSLRRFDDLYTAPLHGFRDAADYYARCSSRQWLGRIVAPTLLVSAADDPFLGPACHPAAAAASSSAFHFLGTAHGGHVGFVTGGGEYWSERQAAAFLAAPA